MTPKQPIKRATDHHTVMTVISAPKPEPKAKKAKNPPIDKEAYVRFRLDKGFTLFCDSGFGGFGHDIHHCLIGRKKGHPELDDYRNYAWVNHTDHDARKFDTRTWRKYFWQLNCRRYGRTAMMEWVNSLPEKMRSRIDWL